MKQTSALDRCKRCGSGGFGLPGSSALPSRRVANLGRARHRFRSNLMQTYGLLQDILGTFRSEKTHAPELVAIDMDSEGGLGGTSAEIFGPLAVILIGYHPTEFEAFRRFMIDMEADMVKLVCCDATIARKTLREVFQLPAPAVTEPRLGARRAVILSGMRGDEVSEVIGAYNDSDPQPGAGLPETVWAAAVPSNFDRRVADLVEDIYGDHMYLRRNPDAVPR